MSKRFTLAEAESLLPEVEKAMREALSVKAEYDRAESSLQATVQKIMFAGGMTIDSHSVGEEKSKRDSSAEQLRSALESLQEHGCLVKDLDVGLVDFPTLFRGEEVFLCWKLGEPGIRFWHGTEEGFAGRKEIDQDFLDNHQGGPLH
jgi:hypothetical protein